jgi:hypothetical protein
MWMRAERPKTVMFSAECLYSGPLLQVPHADRLVLAGRDNKFASGVKDRTGNVIEVSAARVNFPRLCLAHAPQAYRPVVRGGYD